MFGFRLFSTIFLISVIPSESIPLESNEDGLNDRRLSVVFLGNDWIDPVFLFRCVSGNLQWTVTSNELATQIRVKSQWNEVEVPERCLSNPATISGPQNTTFLFYQDVNGQVNVNQLFLHDKSPKFGQWHAFGGPLPFNKDAVVHGFDSVIVKSFQSKVYVFARSQTNTSQLYWSALNVDLTFSKWQNIGGTKALLFTDVSVAYNTFTKLMDAFMVSTDGYMYRSWQLSFDKWASWDKTGYSAPKTIHAPVVHAMGYNIFNGKLNVFIHGTDGKLHHISQTTCDKVPNPWGWCTWGVWHSVSGQIPVNANYPANSLSIGSNLHLGIEVFAVDGNGQLNKVWQMKRGKDYSSWEHVEATQEYKIQSLPAIVNDPSGWWAAYSMDEEGNLVIVNQNRKMSVTPSSVQSGGQISVTWNMPKDEASNKDWIGIYPRGHSNTEYADFVYVGGTQNPMSEIITDGKVSFTTYLPAGSYDVRYLVDRQFVAATAATLTITDGPAGAEWVQIFQGIFTGINTTAVHVESCVKDATNIPLHFQASFQAFRDRAIYKGLHLFGVAIGDIVAGMIDCGVEKAITGRIKQFGQDLVACFSEGNCTHFFIDIAKELLVLYENVYEIYGDIRGASNCFNYKAYTQGGVNIGRVINACIQLPRYNQ